MMQVADDAEFTKGDLEALVGALDPSDSTAVREWLTNARGDAMSHRRLSVGAEALAGGPRKPADDDPEAIRTVGIIGGGTAGYLTALALVTKRPSLRVSLVETPTVPIIGVGESSTPLMVTFLTNYLGVEPADLYEAVAPTWKLGIRFDWGSRSEGFVAPFDWDTNSVGIGGSLAELGHIDAATVQGLMMRADRVPIHRLPDGEHVSLLKYLPFAYHLDNARFVAFLADLAKRRGVTHVDARIDDVVLRDDEWIDHLRTSDSRELRFDMYVDCTGFRSELLGRRLRTPFVSYADSLFTDRAVTGNVAHGGHLRPYTTATTMDAGWCWSIPTRESDHLGYVYASRALDDDAAAAELARLHPGVSEPRLVRFRVGRHEQIWRGNVMGVGNSYAFVEPLESSGLLMITLAAVALVNSLPSSWAEPAPRDFLNTAFAYRWDAIRWFLSVHYRFNRRRDTPFWKDVRAHADTSGLDPLLEVYRGGAPLRFRDPLTRGFAHSTAPTFYGLAGIDTVLLGQEEPCRVLPSVEPAERWRSRKKAADALVRSALPQSDALAVVDSTPRLHRELFVDRDSWASRTSPTNLF